MSKALLKVEGLKKYFPIRKGVLNSHTGDVKAVDDVSFEVFEGETLGIVGESGCGKSTTGRLLMRLLEPTGGRIEFAGKMISELSNNEMRKARRDIQMIFQDPFSSLNPKKRVKDIIAEPLRNAYKLSKEEEKKRVYELLEQVGLSAASIYKYPHEFSGGQLQRIGIARAIALNPKLIIADEPVSALDVSIQAQVLNFMQDIQKELNLTYLIISHDLGVIKHMSDHIGVMYKGRFIEQGLADEVFENPQHIYTKRLISAIPDINPQNREEQIKIRQKIQKEYKDSYDYYFNTDGLARELVKISETHTAAIPKKGSK